MNMKTGKQLRAWRESRGISREALARELSTGKLDKCSSATIYQAEKSAVLGKFILDKLKKLK